MPAEDVSRAREAGGEAGRGRQGEEEGEERLRRKDGSTAKHLLRPRCPDAALRHRDANSYNGQKMGVSERTGEWDWDKGWGEGDPLMRSCITPFDYAYQ